MIDRVITELAISLSQTGVSVPARSPWGDCWALRSGPDGEAAFHPIGLCDVPNRLFGVVVKIDGDAA